MTLFKTWKKQKLVLGEVEPTYKVKYLGNVQTGFLKGDGCVDKPTGVLWNNFNKNGQAVGLDMSLTICGTGMKAITREQGLTEYRAYRISFCIAHPKYPKLFVWVYRHEGKKMKVELRCHAVLCKSESKAKLMAVQLHDKLTFALSEFMREKTRRQNTRLAFQRITVMTPASASGISGVTRRNKFLSTAHNFKPSIENSAGAPKLGAISEDREEEEEEEEDEDEESDIGLGPVLMNINPSLVSLSFDSQSVGSASSPDRNVDSIDLVNGMYELVIGNDIEQLKHELQSNPGDSDTESTESGFSEQGINKTHSSVVSGNEDCTALAHMNTEGEIVSNFSNNNSVELQDTPTNNVSSVKVRIPKVDESDMQTITCLEESVVVTVL